MTAAPGFARAPLPFPGTSPAVEDVGEVAWVRAKVRPVHRSDSSDPPLRLRPGCRVVRHDESSLAVVLGSRRCLVPDSPTVREALESWQRPGGCAAVPRDIPAQSVRERLVAGDWLVPVTLFRDWPADPTVRAALTASLDADGSSHGVRREQRSRTLVRVDAPSACRVTAESLLATVGLGLSDVDDAAHVRLVVSCGEPARDLADPWLRTGLAHLFLTLDADEVRIGPFVHPGVTACLRCADAERAVDDPAWPVHALQLGAAAPLEGLDPAAMHLGLAWAVRDLAAWAVGTRPSTWSTTVRVGRDLSVERRHHLRHPHCGCGWDELAG